MTHSIVNIFCSNLKNSTSVSGGTWSTHSPGAPCDGKFRRDQENSIQTNHNLNRKMPKLILCPLDVHVLKLLFISSCFDGKLKTFCVDNYYLLSLKVGTGL